MGNSDTSVVTVMGMDVGFRKTGLAVFHLHAHADSLIAAETIQVSHAEYPDPLHMDIDSCWNLFSSVEDRLKQYKPEALFIEMPHGGSQQARANRCMSMATAVIVCLIKSLAIRYEVFTPTEVEKALGIYLTAKHARLLEIPKGKTGKYKKEKQKLIAKQYFPTFDKWPETKELAEDSYDAVCAFLAARARDTQLYRWASALRSN
jgi:Holliday junction resolvasome RuvABC endonuclease subunit